MIIIVLSVIIPNIPYLFTDTLWHDDGLWYYTASEGVEIHQITWLIQATSKIEAYRKSIYSNSMVYLGLPFTRGMYTLVMALVSLLLFYYYKSVLGVNEKVAFLAAVIPNILPSLIGIPAGVNASYAVWSLAPLIVGMFSVHLFFQQHGYKRIIFFLVSFCFFVVGVNFGASSGFFLVPCVLYIFILYFPKEKLRALLYSLPFLFYGLWMVYRYTQQGIRSPEKIGMDVIYERIIIFFEMSSFIPFNQPYSIFITFSLIVLGLYGILTLNKGVVCQPKHFDYHHNIYRVLLTGWPICWIIVNMIPYVAFVSEFRTDWAYVFNFGSVMLQAAGIVMLSTWIVKCIGADNYKRNMIVIIIIASVLVYTGFQRIQYKSDEYGRKTAMEETSALIRNNLAAYSFPEGTQIIVLGMYSSHTGNFRVNTGYLRYLLGRNDIYGIIGPDKYPNDVFAASTGWFHVMCGFDKNKPIAAFRLDGSKLVPLDFLLQVIPTGEKALPRLNWALYDISNTQLPPLEIARGEGMSTFIQFMDYEASVELRSADIAFGPPGVVDEFVTPSLADYLERLEGLLNEELNFENNISVSNVFVTEDEDSQLVLNVLMRIDSFPIDPVFRLGYEIGIPEFINNSLPFSLWDYVLENDNVLLRIPIMEKSLLSDDLVMNFSLVNVGKWPREYLVIRGGQFDGEKIATLQLPAAIKIHQKEDLAYKVEEFADR